MERLTHERKSGMKTGYWSPNKKQERVDRLAMYEDREDTKDTNVPGKWIPCSERLPELKLVYESKFNNKYESEQVLVQTKRGEMFAAKCMKCTYTKDFKDEIEFYTYGTGGRRMKVKSKVVAWMPLPELYKTTKELRND